RLLGAVAGPLGNRESLVARSHRRRAGRGRTALGLGLPRRMADLAGLGIDPQRSRPRLHRRPLRSLDARPADRAAVPCHARRRHWTGPPQARRSRSVFGHDASVRRAAATLRPAYLVARRAAPGAAVPGPAAQLRRTDTLAGGLLAADGLRRALASAAG